MADKSTVYTLTTSWSSTNRLAASGETPARISNPNIGSARVAYAVTTDTTEPAMAPAAAVHIRASDHHDITLADGEYLWLAAVEGNATTANVMV